jgi:pimeloyl-ACP methyl ester carboxylesterase
MTTSDVAAAKERDIRTPDGRTLRVYGAGDPNGELVLFHHGTPGSGILAGWWVEDAIARGIRLVGYDRPGYGGSGAHAGRSVAHAATDAAAIADAMGVSRFRTWGASGGGPHALACAALLPDRVAAAATLASVAPYDADTFDWLAGMGQDNVDEFGAAAVGEEALGPFLAQASAGLVAAGPEGLAEQMASLLPSADLAALSDGLASFMHATMAGGLRSGHDGWLHDDMAFTRPWGFDVSSITVPVLVVQGRQDLMVPFAHGEWLAAHIPGVTPRLTENDGHLNLITDVGGVHAWLLEHE